ncbi:transposase domain protein [Shigella flexneri K-218]|nr:transposase domain protein [Shigella flexneri K-218]
MFYGNESRDSADVRQCAVTHHAFSSGAGRTSDGNGSHASTLKSPSYTKSVSWQHYQKNHPNLDGFS